MRPTATITFFLLLLAAAHVPAPASPVVQANPPAELPSDTVQQETGAILLAAAIAGENRARFALERASHPRVRELACGLVASYAASRVLIEEAYGPDLDADAAPAARELVERTDEQLRELRSRFGMDMDRAYLAAELEHQRWLSESLARWLESMQVDSPLHELLAGIDTGFAESIGAIELLTTELVGYHN